MFLNDSDQVSTFKGREIPTNIFKHIIRIIKTLAEINFFTFYLGFIQKLRNTQLLNVNKCNLLIGTSCVCIRRLQYVNVPKFCFTYPSNGPLFPEILMPLNFHIYPKCEISVTFSNKSSYNYDMFHTKSIDSDFIPALLK